MSGRFSNTSAKPRSRASVAELRARVGDDGEPAGAVGPLPGPLEVAARLDRGARLRRREVQRARRVGTSRPIRAMAAGSVVSSTWRRGRPGAGSQRAGQHLGEEARAAHAHHEHVRRCPSTSASHALGERRAGRRAPRRPPGSSPAGRPARWGRRARGCGRPRTAGGRRRARPGRRRTASRASSKASCGRAYPAAARHAASDAAASVAAATISSTTVVGVGEAGEHHLVGAGGEGDAAVEHGVEEGGVARGVGALGARVVDRRLGAEEQADERVDLRARRRRCRPPSNASRRPVGEALGGGA